MEKNELLMIYGTDYKEMAKRLLEAADLAERIPSRDSRIGLKPNLVSPSEASWGATTHPEVVAGTIEYLREHGFENLVILEGSWVGDKTREAFEVCGYDRLVREYGVEFIDTQKDTFHTENCAGMELELCDCVRQLDVLINLPVLKGHCQTGMTCEGTLPDADYLRAEKHERADPQSGEAPFPRNGASSADCPSQRGDPPGFYSCGQYLRGSGF